MSAHIRLIDVDRPREPLEVEVVESNAQMMRVAVPRTVMEFQLRRSHDGVGFEGVIGGRFFRFYPSAPTTSLASKGKEKATKTAVA